MFRNFVEIVFFYARFFYTSKHTEIVIKQSTEVIHVLFFYIIGIFSNLLLKEWYKETIWLYS